MSAPRRSTRSLLGATTREAVRAQLREEQLLIAVARMCPPNAGPANTEASVTASKPTEATTEEPDEGIVDMTPSSVREAYGDLSLPSAPPAPRSLTRVESQRFTHSDLSEWMTFKCITRDMLEVSSRLLYLATPTSQMSPLASSRLFSPPLASRLLSPIFGLRKYGLRKFRNLRALRPI